MFTKGTKYHEGTVAIDSELRVLIATSLQNVAASTITIYSFDWVSYFFPLGGRKVSSIDLSKENPKELREEKVKRLDAKEGEQERANALIDVAFGSSHVYRPTSRTKRCTGDVQNSEGRIGCGEGGGSRAGKSRCIMWWTERAPWSPFVISIG